VRTLRKPFRLRSLFRVAMHVDKLAVKSDRALNFALNFAQVLFPKMRRDLLASSFAESDVNL
jgi:hypothetical protein